MLLKSIHHVAIICSDYEKSKRFYTEVLGLEAIGEHYREERQSYKLDLAIHEHYQIELFSFPDPPERKSYPEAAGLRHIAFSVGSIEKAVNDLHKKGVQTEPIRIDPFTQKAYTFLTDPDGLPIELYEE
ncbi:MAG TPA: VOC family protein [Bacillus sp. (in: firmicutes)]|uniref:SMU1112c/YaeR family gloxylase I-like metalloprotein n=1 Tax=Bacillus litorisediminis TaxID=2922713 RepID=UPI001FB045A5|nr:VOC family protein [Bacillus litorisediminis]HWO78371.1 VOC family protein [Bacillus sp. (in: firmicutes)]